MLYIYRVFITFENFIVYPSKISVIYKICKIEVYLLKYYFKIHLYINDAIIDLIFNQLIIIVSYVDIIVLCHSVAIL